MSENINSLPEMKPFRRKLRNNMTAAEVALWVIIKKKTKSMMKVIGKTAELEKTVQIKHINLFFKVVPFLLLTYL